MRDTTEVLARIEIYDKHSDSMDFFGTTRTDLISVLPYEAAKPWLSVGSIAQYAIDGWTPATYEQIRTLAIEYLDFAWEKVANHRGLSASRSLDHYNAWLWLLFDNDTHAQWWENIPYPQYGAPMLAAAATLLGQPLPTDPALVRMMAGQQCKPGCTEGCAA